MAKASASFGRLRQRLWNNHYASMRVKGTIYRAIVLSTLLYGAEAWTVYRRQVKKLHAFMMRHLRSIVRITWMDSDKQGNTRTDRATIYGRSSDQKESPVDWIPHEDVTRQATKPCSLLSTVFWSQKERAPSSPVQGYHLEKLKLRDIKTDTWISLSQQRDKWRALVKWWKQSLSLRDRQHDDDDVRMKCLCDWLLICYYFIYWLHKCIMTKNKLNYFPQVYKYSQTWYFRRACSLHHIW